MTIAEKLESKTNDVAATFARNTGIRGLEFHFETKNGRNGPYYFYAAAVPSTMIGILANNFHNVTIVIQAHVIGESAVILRANFQYEHFDGGSNGVSVMEANSTEETGKMFETMFSLEA